MYQLCYRFVGNHEDASDLSQDVFLRAYRGLGKFRGGSSLAHVALPDRREPLPEPRGTKVPADRSQSTTVSTSTPGSNQPPIASCARSAAAQVRAGDRQLPPKQRATLILRMYHELSHEEIAGILGSSVGAVKANFFHALGNLRRQLGDDAV